MRYRRKAIEVDAIQWTGENLAEIGEWVKPATVHRTSIHGLIEVIDGSRGLVVRLWGNDWLIRHGGGTLSSVDADAFAVAYEPADSPPYTTTSGSLPRGAT